MNDGAAVIRTEGLGRRFGRRWAVAEVDVALGPGECLAVFGPNGAGKTTLLRMLAGLLAPTAGRAWVDGVALPGRAAVGLISHHSMLYPALTGRENVEFAAQLYGVAEPRGAVERALDMMGVLERADVPVRQLSRGLQQRVSIARAFVHGPRVVLLDEPFSGLDAAGAQVLARALGELKVAGAAMVLVTHNFDEGLGLATQTLVMRDGRPVRAERRGDVDPVEFGAWYRAEVVL